MKEHLSIVLPLYSFFNLIRKDSLLLGMEDYFLWIEALEGGFGLKDLSSLKYLCKILWYKPDMDWHFFETQLEESLHKEIQLVRMRNRKTQEDPQSILENGSHEPKIDKHLPPSNQKHPTNLPIDEPVPDESTQKEEYSSKEFIVSLQSVAEKQNSLEVEKNRGIMDYAFDFSSKFLPLVDRKVSLSFRFLRNMVPVVDKEEIDIDSTLNVFLKKGFVSEFITKKQLRNQFYLTVLLDYGGSMEPFHSIIEELLQSISQADVQLNLYYFFNSPENGIFLDKGMLNLLEEGKFFSSILETSSIIILSDAGAARGSKNSAKIKDLLNWFYKFKQNGIPIVWINPVPKDRWSGTSAENISKEVRMFDLEEKGIDRIVNLLLGKEYVYKN